MAITLGIDIGSTSSKCVLLEDGKNIIDKTIYHAGAGTVGAAKAFEEILEKNNLKEDDLDFIMATGYGRTIFKAAHSEVSELSCHAKGVFASFPEVRTIIDIGGQDAKVIRLTDRGIIDSFVMNDKCAAGTGRFLEVMSVILQTELGEMEKHALEAKKPVKISSTCTVFAESEVISQLSKGETTEDIIGGICTSVASKVATLAKRGVIKDKIFMSGGVAQNGGVRDALSKVLDKEILHSDSSQYMGALGAAIVGYERHTKQFREVN